MNKLEVLELRKEAENHLVNELIALLDIAHEGRGKWWVSDPFRQGWERFGRR